MIVQGTQNNRPLPLEINVDTVYKRNNIEQLTDNEGRQFWQYDEIQIPIDEYFRSLIPNNEAAIGELSLLFANYQQQTDQALAELSILIGGNFNV